MHTPFVPIRSFAHRILVVSRVPFAISSGGGAGLFEAKLQEERRGASLSLSLSGPLRNPAKRAGPLLCPLSTQ